MENEFRKMFEEGFKKSIEEGWEVVDDYWDEEGYKWRIAILHQDGIFKVISCLCVVNGDGAFAQNFFTDEHAYKAIKFLEEKKNIGRVNRLNGNRI